MNARNTRAEGHLPIDWRVFRASCEFGDLRVDALLPDSQLFPSDNRRQKHLQALRRMFGLLGMV